MTQKRISYVSVRLASRRARGSRPREMMENMRTCKDPKEAQNMLAELDELLDRAPLLGFADKGENQWKYQLASTYSDEYISNPSNGTYLLFFSICMSGHKDWPCMTIQQSKGRKTKSGDPLWPNGYTCPCGTTYRTKYGVVIELVADSIEGILYCRAPVPDDRCTRRR